MFNKLTVELSFESKRPLVLDLFKLEIIVYSYSHAREHL
jgi:hypothetical protein